MSSDSEDPEEVEEDPRIARLYNFSDKQCDDDGLYNKDADGSAFVKMLDEVGTADAIVLGSLWAGKAVYARAHFAVAALMDADEMTVAKCLELKRVPLKACVKSGGEGAGVAMIAALERYTTTECEDKKLGVKAWAKLLQYLWEYEITTEEDIRAWNDDPRAAGCFMVAPTAAQDLRERSEKFFEWLEQGEAS